MTTPHPAWGAPWKLLVVRLHIRTRVSALSMADVPLFLGFSFELVFTFYWLPS